MRHDLIQVAQEVCDLIRGSAEVSVCHEDADSLAFMDIQPVNAGHVLVVPRAHYNSPDSAESVIETGVSLCRQYGSHLIAVYAEAPEQVFIYAPMEIPDPGANMV